VRRVGGLARSSEAQLEATIDFLKLGGVAADQDPAQRARDLLITFVRRGCDRYKKQHRYDKTAKAAAASLEHLILRPATDTTKVQRVRTDAVRAAKQSISPDAIRHREDKIIDEIAQEVFENLQHRRLDEPQSVEAALHDLLPIAADLRQQLHDGLCLNYLGVQGADPRDRKMVEFFYNNTIIELGRLVLASHRLAVMGRRSGDLTRDEYFFVHLAANINHFVLDEAADKQFLLDFTRADESNHWRDSLANLRSSDQGEVFYQRWMAWIESCYAECAFERSTSIDHMCSPHALVTLLYEIEIRYQELGYAELDIQGNGPILHHGLGRWRDESINPDGRLV
jgi:hypothetical protein